MLVILKHGELILKSARNSSMIPGRVGYEYVQEDIKDSLVGSRS